MLWEEELEAKRLQDDQDRKRKVGEPTDKQTCTLLVVCYVLLKCAIAGIVDALTIEGCLLASVTPLLEWFRFGVSSQQGLCPTCYECTLRNFASMFRSWTARNTSV